MSKRSYLLALIKAKCHHVRKTNQYNIGTKHIPNRCQHRVADGQLFNPFPLCIRQELHRLFIAPLNFSFILIIRVGGNQPELQSTPKQCLNILMIVSNCRLPHILHRLFRLNFRIRPVYLHTMQISVEQMQVLDCQVRPPPHYAAFNHRRHRPL